MQGYIVLSGVYRRVADRVGGEIMLPVWMFACFSHKITGFSPSCIGATVTQPQLKKLKKLFKSIDTTNFDTITLGEVRCLCSFKFKLHLEVHRVAFAGI